MKTLQLVATLDRVRGRTYGYLLRVPGTRSIVARKERRIALLVALSSVFAFALAALVPTFSLIVAPLVLGVPHLAADYRYLLLRPRWPARVLWLTLCGSLVVLSLRAVELVTKRSLAPWEMGAALAWCASMIAAAQQASLRKRSLAAIALSVVAVLALIEPELSRLVFGYAHNLVAIGLWLLLFRGMKKSALLPLGMITLGTLLLLLGGDRWLLFGQTSLGLNALTGSDFFALPSVGGAGLGLITSFAFLQSVHYAIWLHVIPAEELPGNRMSSFAQTFSGLRSDLGLAGLAVVALLVVVTTAGLLVSPEQARQSYTSLSTFHGYMELAIALYAYLTYSGTGSRFQFSRKNAA